MGHGYYRNDRAITFIFEKTMSNSKIMHKTTHKIMIIFSISFLAFIAWVIYLANTAQPSVFFELIAHIPYGDKVGHFCLFGFLSFGANFAFKLKKFSLGFFKLYWGSAAVLLFVVIEELSQYFIPNRTLDATDLIADFLGIIVFSFITRFISLYNDKSIE